MVLIMFSTSWEIWDAAAKQYFFLWPKIAAVGEILWSPAPHPNDDDDDDEDAAAADDDDFDDDDDDVYKN